MAPPNDRLQQMLVVPESVGKDCFANELAKGHRSNEFGYAASLRAMPAKMMPWTGHTAYQ